jgi:acetyl-CoA acyltransferase 2
MYIVAAKRTAFGAFGGTLKDLSATDLGVIATKAALESASIDPERVDQCYFGNVIQSSRDAAYLSRHVALLSGCKITTPSLTINRLCGSGFETVIQAVKSIACDANTHLVIAGGTESMSQAPLTANGVHARFGVTLGHGLKLSDALWDGLTDTYANIPMGMTAENLAKEYSIAREMCDEFAIRSQVNWGEANVAGIFQNEIAPVEITSKKGTTAKFDVDEHPRPNSDPEKLAKLKPVFLDKGVVTAANASGICDGAGSLLIASEQAIEKYNLAPLCKIAGFAVTGCDPKIMGIGPVEAIRQTLQSVDLALDDMDRIEINEAFAAQFLACAKELQVDLNKTNIHGGAIALGHPLAASGSRILAHLAHSFAANPQHKYYLGAACIGGGQGIAVLLERC